MVQRTFKIFQVFQVPIKLPQADIHLAYAVVKEISLME